MVKADELELRRGRLRVQGRVWPSEALLRVVDAGHNFASILNPALLPMLVRPLPWTGPMSGGYLKCPTPIMRIRGDSSQVLSDTRARPRHCPGLVASDAVS